MKKVFVLAPNEDWICDRFVKEWSADNADITTHNPWEADVIWLLADWAWNQLPIQLLQSKKVLTTVHHVVPGKFGDQQRHEFFVRDSITNAYHVPNNQTRSFIDNLTKRPIHTVSYWANQSIWRKTGDKQEFRRKYGIPSDGFVLGSFQRDTEGHDLKSPKLEKGPDLFVDFIEHLKQECRDPFVVLAGWRRQYVTSRLSAAGVPYAYLELPEQSVVNELYQTLDLYPVTSRFEGGPQSLIECGLLGIPCVSRDVGIATAVLEPSSICDDVSLAIPTVPNVTGLTLPDGYEQYRRIIQSL